MNTQNTGTGYTVEKHAPKLLYRYTVRRSGVYVAETLTFWGARRAIRTDRKRRQQGTRVVHTEPLE